VEIPDEAVQDLRTVQDLIATVDRAR